MRVEICASDDYDTRDRLLAALAEIGAAGEGDGEPLGVGLNRFRAGFDTLTVFIDAWLIDLDGPDEVVRRVVELISAGDRG